MDSITCGTLDVGSIPIARSKDLRCNSIFLIFRFAVIKPRKRKSDLFHWDLSGVSSRHRRRTMPHLLSKDGGI